MGCAGYRPGAAVEGEPGGAIADGIAAVAVEGMSVTDAKVAEKQAVGIIADVGGEAGEIERFAVGGFEEKFLGEDGEGEGVRRRSRRWSDSLRPRVSFDFDSEPVWPLGGRSAIEFRRTDP